jgi:hypothetical protein
MIIHMSKSATAEQQQSVLDRVKQAGFNHDVSHGTTGIELTGVLGDTSRIEESFFAEMDGVDKVIRISKPYKLVSREYSPKTRIVKVGDAHWPRHGTHGRPVLAGERGASPHYCQVRGGTGDPHHAGWRVQAVHLSVQFSGAGSSRTCSA